MTVCVTRHMNPYGLGHKHPTELPVKYSVAQISSKHILAYHSKNFTFSPMLVS